MRSVSEKCNENQNTHIMFKNFAPENCVFYEMKWKKLVRTKQATDDNTIWCMRVACWICKATDILSEHEITIAFPQQ